MSRPETRATSSKNASHGKKKSPSSDSARQTNMESTETFDLAVIFRTLPDTITQLTLIQKELVSRIEDLTSYVGVLEDKLNSLQTKVNPTTPDVCPTCSGTTSTSTHTPKAVEQRNDSNSESSKLALDVANILMKEKKQQVLKDECRAIKSDIILDWDSNLKSRNKFFRNFVKNNRKAQLYDDWATKSPNYIPFKHRPKRIPGEMEKHRTARIEEAKRKYSTERELLKGYAQSHLDKVKEIDKRTAELFRSKVDNDHQYSLLIEQWEKETRKDESRAQLLWTRNENFLKKKKHEDEQQGNGALVDTTWSEKLRSYGRKKDHSTPQAAANSPPQFYAQYGYPAQLPWRLY